MDDIHILWNDAMIFFSCPFENNSHLFHQQGQKAN